MMSYLPWYYQGSAIMTALMDSGGMEMDSLRAALDGILDQAFASKATWGIDRWESELGLPPVLGYTDQERRERILGKLRGFGTATLARVKAYAETFQYGEVSVVEDYGSYAVHITFIGTSGIPAKLADFQAAMRAIIPAHLDISYIFTYFIWDELDQELWLWDTLDGLMLTFDQLEVYA